MSIDVFGKFDGVDGESSDVDHKDWIEIMDISTGIQLPFSNSSYSASGGGTNTGRADFGLINITKLLEKSSVKLQEKCGTGATIPTGEIHFCQAGDGDKKHVFLKYELRDVIITSYNVSASRHDDSRPQENLSIAYGNIIVSYKNLEDEGKAGAEVKFEYSLKENKKV